MLGCAAGQPGAERQRAGVRDHRDAFAGQRAEHSFGKRPQSRRLGRSAQAALPADLAGLGVEPDQRVAGLGIEQLGSAVDSAAGGVHPPELLPRRRIDADQLSLALDDEGSLIERHHARSAGERPPPHLPIHQAPDPAAGERRFLLSPLARRGRDHCGGRTAQVAALQIRGMPQQRLGAVAQVRRELVGAGAQGLVCVQLRRSGGHLGEAQRRQLERLPPALRAHLVAGEVPAKLMRAEGEGERGLAAFPRLDQPFGVPQ